jgi:hypothetical protein
MPFLINSTALSSKASNATLTYVNQGADSLTWSEPRLADGSPAHAYGDAITLTDGTSTWFVGKITGIRRSADPASESHTYTSSGPWHQLTRHIYRQSWVLKYVDGTPTYYTTSAIRTGQDLTGAKIPTDDVLAALIDYAITDCGVNLQAGTIATGVDAPYDDLRDTTIAEAITRVLRWTPDQIPWVDYTTTPPTLNITKRSAATAVDIAALDGATASNLDLVPRSDLVPGAVLLTYRWGGTDGTAVEDIYPAESTGTEENAIVATIDLDSTPGTPGRYERQDVEVAALPTNIDGSGSTTLAWWKERLPYLNDPRIDLKLVADVEPGTFPEYANELVKGTVPAWTGKEIASTQCYATIDYDLYDDSVHTNLIQRVIAQPVHLTITLTNASTKQYKRWIQGVNGTAEPQPVGLAHALYDSLSTVNYEGSVTVQQAECTDLAQPGRNTLNITGGLAAWATMAAVIQSVSHDLDTGRTTITVGPPQHLSPQDLAALVRNTRLRNVSSNPRQGVDGDTEPDDTGDLEGVTATPQKSGAGESGVTSLQRFYHPEMPNKHVEIKADDQAETVTLKISDDDQDPSVYITLDPADITATTNREAKFRQLDICVDGESMLAWVLMTEPEAPPA